MEIIYYTLILWLFQAGLSGIINMFNTTRLPESFKNYMVGDTIH
jgi:hypothetical protein